MWISNFFPLSYFKAPSAIIQPLVYETYLRDLGKFVDAQSPRLQATPMQTYLHTSRMVGKELGSIRS
jgi:hypothetical protein